MEKTTTEKIETALRYLETYKVTMLYAMQTPEFIKFITGTLTDKERETMAKRIKRRMDGDDI